MQQVNLNGTWQLAFGQQGSHTPHSPKELLTANLESIPARVPGNVELDLLTAGKIEEPSIGNRIYNLRRFETYEWWYQRTFSAPKLSDGQRAELVFEGLDCFGTIWLNDAFVGTADNMLIAHRFDVTDQLRSDC